MARPRYTPPQPRRPMHQGHNPVRAAIAIESQRQHTQNLAVLVTLADDGQEHRDMLANLAFVIALGAEIAVNVNKQHPASRRLHDTLRTIVDMASQGCIWKSAHARVIAQDLDVALQLTKDYPDVGLSVTAGCKALSHDIRTNNLQPGAIAGAEIYKEEGATA